MHRPIFQTITTSVTSPAIPLDRYSNGYALGVSFSNSTMTATYTVQLSMMDPYATYSNSYKVSGNWMNSTDPVFVSQSASRTSNFAFPPMATRIITSSVSGGSLTYSVIPMGMDE